MSLQQNNIIGRRRQPVFISLLAATVVLQVLVATPVAVAQETSVVARIDGEAITEDDLAVAQEMYGSQLGGMPEDAKRSMLVDALIEVRLIGRAARWANIQNSDAYKRQMAFFDGQTLRALYIEQQIKSAVSDAAVRAAYDRQVAEDPPVEDVRLAHILVSDEATARDIISALKAGKDFAELAREKSLDTASKNKGGDLGFMVAGQTILEIDAAAAKLEPGRFTETPVKSPFGFHVVKVQERRNRPALSFETLAPQIQQSLAAETERQLVEELRAAAKIEKLVPDVAAPAEAEDGHQHSAQP